MSEGTKAAQPFVDLLPEAAREGGEPVFAEPWQAQAFAMTVLLHRGGAFAWSEWAEALGRELRAEPEGDDANAHYYAAWLRALESLVTAKALGQAEELAHLKADWAEAYRTTPHGQPVVLKDRPSA